MLNLFQIINIKALALHFIKLTSKRKFYSIHSDYLLFSFLLLKLLIVEGGGGEKQAMFGNLQASHLIIHICTKGITSDLVFYMNLFGAERFKRKLELQNKQNVGSLR